MRLDNALQTVAAAHKAGPEMAKLKKAAAQVEAIFVKDLIGALRRGTPDSLGQGFGASVYRDLFDQSLSDSLAQKGSFGISGMLTRQLGKSVLGQEIAKIKLAVRAEGLDRKD